MRKPFLKLVVHAQIRGIPISYSTALPQGDMAYFDYYFGKWIVTFHGRGFYYLPGEDQDFNSPADALAAVVLFYLRVFPTTLGGCGRTPA
jgi:hypothetical protein